jgi:SAM-dependent methyltransferase
MNHNDTNAYDADFHVAEIYDQHETGLDDVNFIRHLIGNSGPLNILEPFCGTGRILIPLVLEGHRVSGMDQSAGMLNRARRKMGRLSLEAQKRISLSQVDVLCNEWPRDFDLVILGCNCFYELATPDEQEKCVVQAFRSLKPGGYVFIDNNHMEGELAASGQDIGVIQPSLNGRCSDGTMVESTRETIWFDAPHRLVQFRRRTRVTLLDGSRIEQEYIQQKHPVSKNEVQNWLETYNFMIEGIYGSYDGLPYTESSPRAIFWARRS